MFGTPNAYICRDRRPRLSVKMWRISTIPHRLRRSSRDTREPDTSFTIARRQSHRLKRRQNGQSRTPVPTNLSPDGVGFHHGSDFIHLWISSANGRFHCALAPRPSPTNIHPTPSGIVKAADRALCKVCRKLCFCEYWFTFMRISRLPC